MAIAFGAGARRHEAAVYWFDSPRKSVSAEVLFGVCHKLVHLARKRSYDVSSHLLYMEPHRGPALDHLSSEPQVACEGRLPGARSRGRFRPASCCRPTPQPLTAAQLGIWEDGQQGWDSQ